MKKMNCLVLMLTMAFALTGITACGDTFTGPVIRDSPKARVNNYQPSNDGNESNPNQSKDESETTNVTNEAPAEAEEE